MIRANAFADKECMIFNFKRTNPLEKDTVHLMKRYRALC